MPESVEVTYCWHRSDNHNSVAKTASFTCTPADDSYPFKDICGGEHLSYDCFIDGFEKDADGNVISEKRITALFLEVRTEITPLGHLRDFTYLPIACGLGLAFLPGAFTLFTLSPVYFVIGIFYGYREAFKRLKQ